MFQVDTTKRPQQPDTSHQGVALGAPRNDSAALTSLTGQNNLQQPPVQAQTLTVAPPAPQHSQTTTHAVTVQPAKQPATVTHFYFYDTLKTAQYTADTSETEEYHLLNIDSILASYARTEPLVHPSLFAGHTLQVDSSFPQTYPHHEEHVPEWTFGIILLMAAAIGWFIKWYRLHFGELVQSVTSTSALGRLFRDHNFSNERSLLPMAIVYVAAMSLLTCYAAGLYGTTLFSSNLLTNYLMVLGCCAGYYFVRNGLTLLFGIIFQNAWAAQVYVANAYLFNFLGTIALIPILLVGYYGPLDPAASMTLFHIAAGWVGLLFFLRLVRGMQLILTDAKSSKFYLFYYLCILEIVPILVAIKIFLY